MFLNHKLAAGVVTERPVRIIGKVRYFPMKSSRILGQSHFQRLVLLGCIIIMLCHRRRPQWSLIWKWMIDSTKQMADLGLAGDDLRNNAVLRGFPH